MEVKGTGKAQVDKTAKKITIGKGKSVSLASQSSFSVVSATDSKNKTLTGSAMNKVAKVASGKVIAKGAGVATVKLSGLVENEYTVEVAAPKIHKPSRALKVGGTGSVYLSPSSALPIEWTSSDPGVIQITSSGTSSSASIKALAQGSSTIKATVNGKVFSCKVKAVADKKRLDATSVTLNTDGKGKTKTVKVKGVSKVTWTSADPSVATVDSKGKITAVGAGTTTVTASGYGSVTVNVKAVTVPSSLTVPLGGFSAIGVTVDGSTSFTMPISWKSSKTSVATVNNNGFVRGVKEGKAKLTAKIGGNKYTVNVEVKAEGGTAHVHHYRVYNARGVKYCTQCGSWYFPPTYTVRFVSNNGQTIDSVRIPEGETFQSCGYTLPELTQTGSVFLGWYSDAEMEHLFEIRTPVTENTVLYAAWEVIPEDVEGPIDDPGFLTNEYEIVDFHTSTVNVKAGNTGENIDFYAQLITPTVADTEVAVYDGSTKLIELKDDGIAPDATAEDGIFSGNTNVSSNNVGYKTYTVKYKEKDSKVDVYFYTEIPEDEMTAAAALSEQLADVATKEEALAILNASDIVDQTSIEVSEDNKTISYKTINGIIGVWEEPSAEEDATKGSPADGLTTSPTGLTYDDVRNSLNANPVSAMNSKKDVLVVRPFRSTDFKYDDFKETGEILAGAFNSNCVVKDDSYANRSVFTSFGDYGVVLVDSHGTLSYGYNIPYMLTGDSASNMSTYGSGDLQAGRIITAGGRICVGGDFISAYYDDGSLNNTMLFLGTCYSAYDDSICQAMIDKGASVVFGYTQPVSVGYCNNTLFELVLNELLLKGNTAKVALDNTKDCCGAREANGCELVMYGNENYTLIRSATSSYIAGRVLAYPDRALPNAIVTITNGTTVNRSCRVSLDGSFCQLVPPGTYTVRVTAYGYMTEIRSGIIVTAGQGVNLDQSILLHRVSEATTSITGTVTSSMDGSGVAYAKIKFRINHDNQEGDFLKYQGTDTDVAIYTDANGKYSFNSLPQGYYTMEVTRRGYYVAHKNIVATADTVAQNFSLTPVIFSGDEDLRIVLEWGEYPTDLDSHLVGPRPDSGIFHTWYRDKNAYSAGYLFAYLDLDDISSFGPETTRVYDILDGDYNFYVHNYSGDNRGDVSIRVSNARVMVFDRTGLVDSFNVPTDQGDELYWNVFTYRYNASTGTGRIIPVNTITSSPVVSDNGYYNGDDYGYDDSADGAEKK